MINIDMWYGDKPDEFRLFLMPGKEPIHARYQRWFIVACRDLVDV